MLKMVHKRKSNKKNSKDGVILVTVLFILAMAMIFITSAILLTSGTRGRLYQRAEESQSRLTVTSVAESFYAAIEMHEVNKSMVTSLDGFGPIMVTAAGVPGMSGQADDYTTIEVNKDVATGYYNVDITTVIGTQGDTVRLTLSPNEEEHHDGGGFNHQVEVVGGGQLSNVRIGYNVNTGSRFEADDNTVLSRGQAGSPIGSTDYYSTFITTGAFAPASGSYFYGDVVVWGPAGTVNLSQMNGNGFGMTSDHAIYMVNNDNAFTGTGNTFTQNTGSNLVFSGTNANLDASFGNCTSQAMGHSNGHVYREGSESITSAIVVQQLTAAAQDIQDRLNTYGSDSYVPDQETSGETYYWTQCATKNHLDANCSGGTPYSLSGTGIRDLGPGTYSLSGTLSGLTITCDLSQGDYIFYCPNGISIQNYGLFEFLNADGVHTATFVIGHGKSLTITTDNRAGIIDGSVYGVDSSTPADERVAAYMNNADTPDQSVYPSVYVYGAGMDSSHTRQIYMAGNQGAFLDAYCALYPTTADSNDAGSFWFYNSNGKHFYGRINAYTVLSESGGHAAIPYCPAPHAGEDPNAFYPVKPDFDVVSEEYYYVT